jgi:DNA repair protein RecO (recombination protein O)
MLFQSKGIVLKKIKHGETSLILKIYTHEYGMKSFIIKGSRKKNKLNFLQYLSAVNLTSYYKKNKELFYIKEIENALPHSNITENIYKINLAVFLNEIVLKAIGEEEKNTAVFDFLWNKTFELYEKDSPIGDFHLRFLFSFSSFLGFFPEERKELFSPFFDLRDGIFVSKPPNHREYIEKKDVDIWNKCIQISKQNTSMNMEKEVKKRILEYLLLYYQIHLGWNTPLKSYEIIKEIFA